MGTERFVELVRKERPITVIMLAFLAFPFMAKAWIDLLPGESAWRYWVLAPLLIAFAVLVALMLRDNEKLRRRELARDLTVDYLRRRGFTLVSFQRLERHFPDVPAEDFRGLATAFPDIFEPAVLAKKGPGVRWERESDAAAEETE
jgi:hypothetical protein